MESPTQTAAYTGTMITNTYIVPNIKDFHITKRYIFIKRACDIVLSAFMLVAFSIIMVLIAILVHLDSPGPVLFSQERLGLNGKVFNILKFRTMYLNAEENGPQWAEPDDSRATRLGRHLRKSHLDELPQLFNILRGEMSFVGPRPERPYFYDQFETYIIGFSQRLKVKPGLTGLAQINGGYDLAPEEKIIYDMEYIETCSIWVDLKCLLKTAYVVFSGAGAR